MKKNENHKSEVDLQHEEVFLRDAKHFFDMPKVILDSLDDILPSCNLYELKQLSLSQLSDKLNNQAKVKTVVNAMAYWNLRPKNYKEPGDIIYYDNTGERYIVENGARNYDF